MPADYQSTARALALSTSPPPRSYSVGDDAQSPWNRSAPRRNSAWSSAEVVSLRDQLIDRGTELSHRIYRIWQRMSLLQKLGACVAALAIGSLGIAFLVFTGKLFLWLGPMAEKWEDSALIGFILWLCVFFVSFPPLIGWSTMGTVSGFIFGVWKG